MYIDFLSIFNLQMKSLKEEKVKKKKIIIQKNSINLKDLKWRKIQEKKRLIIYESNEPTYST